MGVLENSHRIRKLPFPLELFWKTFNIHYKSALVSPQVAPVVKKPPANAGGERDMGSISGLARSLEVGNGNPLQYFMDREA